VNNTVHDAKLQVRRLEDQQAKDKGGKIPQAHRFPGADAVLDDGVLAVQHVLPGAEDADEGGIRDADVVTRKGPAAGVAAGPWW